LQIRSEFQKVSARRKEEGRAKKKIRPILFLGFWDRFELYAIILFLGLWEQFSDISKKKS
jgi:hypothetical protein